MTVTGINHAAILTEDLARFVEFYVAVFDGHVVLAEDGPPLRHAMVRLGDGPVLHAIEVDSVHGRGSPAMLARGHLDHLGLDAADAEAFAVVVERLVARGASAGTIEDLGPQLSCWFVDPDGMHAELCVVRDRTLAGFHAPVPVDDAAAP